MVIAIEFRDVVLGRSGGIALLLKGVLEHAIALSGDHKFIVFCTIFNRNLLSVRSENVVWYTFALQTYFSDVGRLCREHRVDVLFRGYPTEDTVSFPLERQIFQIPD